MSGAAKGTVIHAKRATAKREAGFLRREAANEQRTLKRWSEAEVSGLVRSGAAASVGRSRDFAALAAKRRWRNVVFAPCSLTFELRGARRHWRLARAVHDKQRAPRGPSALPERVHSSEGLGVSDVPEHAG